MRVGHCQAPIRKPGLFIQAGFFIGPRPGSNQVTHDGCATFASFATQKPQRRSACAARLQIGNPVCSFRPGFFIARLSLSYVGYSLERAAENTTWPFYGLKESNRGGKVFKVIDRFIGRVCVIRLPGQHAEEGGFSQARAKNCA